MESRIEREFVLSENEISTELTMDLHRLPASEISRRESITSKRYWVRVLVNGHYVARSRKE
jgi:CC2D2A N-terminal C2 domain